MANITSTLQATLVAVDVNNNQPIARNVGNPSLAGLFGDFYSYQNLPTAGADQALSLYNIPILCLYVKNLNAPGGGTLTVKATPQGGVSATLSVLQPGGVLLIWNPTTSGTAGYTAITLNGAAANTLVEYYLGG